MWVPEPGDARLNALIATLVASLDYQTSTEVQEAIAAYLTDNDFTNTASVQELINEAYLNVLRDLGAIQVEYSLDGLDYEEMLNIYQFIRIRLNNPDAEWNIIEVGQDSGMGGGGSSNLKGTLLATCAIPVGSHDHITVFQWTVESGVTIVSAVEAIRGLVIAGSPVTPNGALEVPVTREGRTTQSGWFIEITNNNTIVYERFYPFNGYFDAPNTSAPRANETVTTDGLQVSIIYVSPAGGMDTTNGTVYKPSFFVSNYGKSRDSSPTVIALGNDYQVKFYLSKN